MQCPACGNSLQPLQVGDITVDTCSGGCGGVWFDQLELKRLEDRHDASGQALLDIPANPAASINTNEKRHCPRCGDQPMLRFFYSPHRKVMVDHCPNCGGHWLDRGELRAIHEQYSGEAQRQQEIDSFIQASFGAQIDVMEEERKRHLERSRPLRRIFGFMLPK